MDSQDTPIFTRTFASGGTLEARVRVTDYDTIAPRIFTIYFINGEPRASGSPLKFQQPPRPGYTHYVNAKLDGKRASIPLLAEEVAQIGAAEKAALQAWYDAHPAFVAEMERKRERAKLVEAYQGLISDQTYEYERMHRVGNPFAMPTKLSYEPKIAAALEAVRAFDLAHPPPMKSED